MGYEFMTMLWGRPHFEAFKKTIVAGYAKIAAGPNEYAQLYYWVQSLSIHVVHFRPDQLSQANMTPQEAVGVWREYLEPLKQHGYTLVSPAPTSSDKGTQWLRDFIRLCAGCHVSYNDVVLPAIISNKDRSI